MPINNKVLCEQSTFLATIILTAILSIISIIYIYFATITLDKSARLTIRLGLNLFLMVYMYICQSQEIYKY